MKQEKYENVLLQYNKMFDNFEIKNAFFIKPYDFNSALINKEELDNEYKSVKEILDIKYISTVIQKHTDIVKKVTLDNLSDSTLADGMITNIPNIGLATEVADCQAIFLYDPIKRVIGNIHSGWRGTIKHIIKNALEMMINDYNCNIKDIKVFICPSIGKCHFEVDSDVYLEFKKSFDFDIDEFTLKENNKYYIDTKAINKTYLTTLGVLEENIEISDICTVCDGVTIHSYRYDKENSGRNLAIIAL